MRPVEQERRRAKLEQIARVTELDKELQDRWAQLDLDRDDRRLEILDILEGLRTRANLAVFREQMEEWARRPGFDAFRGFNQMFINQLAKRAADDPEPVGQLLGSVLAVPRDEADAVDKIRRFIDYVESIKRSGQPAPARVPFITSFFWSMQDHDSWPILWPSAELMLQDLGWLQRETTQADRYRTFRTLVLKFGMRPDRVERLLWWLSQPNFAGLDPSLVDRCKESGEIIRRWAEDRAYSSGGDSEIAAQNAAAVKGDLGVLAAVIVEDASIAVGRQLKVSPPQLRTAFSNDSPFRADGWAVLSAGDWWDPSLRVWVTDQGVAVGLYPGNGPRENPDGWHARIGSKIEGRISEGLEFFQVHPHASGSRLTPAGTAFPGGECFVGQWWPEEKALDRAGFAKEVLDVFGRIRPVLEIVVGEMGGSVSTTNAGVTGDLADLVELFRTEAGYPTDKDDWHKAERAEMAEVISKEGLDALDVGAFRRIINTKRYGGPGPMSHLNTTVNTAEATGLDLFSNTLRELLWGDGDDAARIDRVLDPGDLGFVGLGPSIVMKLLAIAHPDRYIPVFPYEGHRGKRGLMTLIDLTPPSGDGKSRGRLQVESNNAIRDRLAPYFPNDLWGMAQFLYWLNAGGGVTQAGPGVDPFEQLATDLLIDKSFVDDMVQLLRGKGQIILYGPPGTGKTFFAKRLAAAIAPDPTRRMIVQFHPSTSYEDFFEGFRPEQSPDGQLSYTLSSGPLAILAERAESAPGIEHVMVIDEINRANLPKVLGELLYLLEYREEAVRTLYRAEEAFELPKQLLFIGTMNTADRSIALVDAALRRRFHFIPFFPSEEPIEGLLRRWLENEHEPVWVADLVDFVNAELVERLGGPHLQIGPSHFMKKDLTGESLRRIWRYDVFPFIEEQLYGQWGEVEEYRWEVVYRRFQDESGLSNAAEGESGLGVEGVPSDDDANG